MLPSPESEVFSVGVPAGAPASRCTYTLIGSRSGRVGTPSIIPTICPLAIWRVHELGSTAPWRMHAEDLIWRGVVTGPAPKSGGLPVWRAVHTAVQSCALPAMLKSHRPSLVSSIRHAFV